MSSKRRVYLHVGTPKSGTTYLQSILRGNKARLAEAGVLVAGENHVDVVNAGLVIREDPRVAKLLSPDDRGAWSRIAEEIRGWAGHSVILSYELLGAAGAKQARRAIADLGDVEVHVVITARDFARAVSSAWQEELKFAKKLPLEKVVPKPRTEFGWLTLDPRGQARRWGSTLPPEQVHIVTMPRHGSDGDDLWSRFAEACDLTGLTGLDLTNTTTNESLGAPGAELLRRVNKQLREPFSDNREHARWLRDTLANQILVPLGSEPLGISDDQFERWSRRSDEAIEELGASGYRVHGDLEDLRATRPEGRRPSEVPDGELLDTAVLAIVELLTMLREQSLLATGEVEPDLSRGRAVARNLVRRAVAPISTNELEKMTRRVDALEAKVQESRALHLRVAELDDILTELLLPAGRGGDDAVRAALKKYRQESV